MSEVPLFNYLTFEADFPDDWEFDQAGEIRRPGGLMIATTLCEGFRWHGYSVSDPQQYSSYGWELIVLDRDVRFQFLLQFPGPWLLLSQNQTKPLTRFFSSRMTVLHRQLLKTLNDSISRDPRFRSIRWFTKDEFERTKPASE